MHFSREEFDKLVAKALADIPQEFREKLDNIYISVEDYPSPQDIQAAGIKRRYLLLGLYHGVPLNRRSIFSAMQMPDHITIFQGPIEQVGQTREGIIEQVRKTVIHEIAHHFGISDKRLRELGY